MPLGTLSHHFDRVLYDRLERAFHRTLVQNVFQLLIRNRGRHASFVLTKHYIDINVVDIPLAI